MSATTKRWKIQVMVSPLLPPEENVLLIKCFQPYTFYFIFMIFRNVRE
jgi:hypothetical protein